MMIMVVVCENPPLLRFGTDQVLIDLRPNSSYNEYSPATSIDRGILFSATWGRIV
jgi:hypothetical protein